MTLDPAVTYGHRYGALHRTLTTHLPANQAEDAIATLAALLTAAEQMHHTLGTMQAITVLRQHGADPGLIDLLLATRTAPVPCTEDVPDSARLAEAVRDSVVSLEQYHDRLVFEYPDVADALQPLIDRLSHAAEAVDEQAAAR